MSIPSGMPAKTVLPSRDFTIASSPGNRERGGAGPPSVFRMERLIVSIFSICYKTKFKRNERHVKLI